MIIEILCVVVASDLIVAAIPPSGKYLETNPFYRRDFEYDEEFHSFYKLHKEAVTRSEAASSCQKEGADLLVPDTPAELSHVNAKLKLDTASATGIFIGDADQCATFQPDIQIWITGCQTKMPFICKRKLSTLKYDAICQTWDPDSTKSRCYKVHSKHDSWNDAFAVCHAEHSYLAIINSQNEADIFAEELNKHPRLHEDYNDHWDGAWLGFHNLFIDTEFRTINGETLPTSGYAMWDELQPSGGERCGQMIRDSLLNDRNCDAVDLFICEREINNFTSSARRNERCGFKANAVNESMGQNGSFRNDYSTQFQSNLYKLHSDSMSWAEAEQTCRAEGALLAAPQSRQEVDFMLQLHNQLAPHDTQSVFVGIHGIFSDSIFITVEGIDVSMAYNEWSSQSRRKYEDCVTLERDGLYRAVYCHKKKPFICKKSMAEFRNVQCAIIETDYFSGVQENRFYKLYEEEKSWKEADEVCQHHNAVLADISSLEMVGLLANHLADLRAGKPEEKQHLYDSVHIDKIASCSDWCNSTFHTVPDSMAIYESEDQCNFLHSDGLIRNGLCNKPQYFYCQLDIDISNNNKYFHENAV